MIGRQSMIGLWATCAFLLTAPTAAWTGQQNPVVLGTAATAPYVRGDASGYLQRLHGELFRRLGMTVEVVELPAERALINANEGIEDGDAMRVGGLEALYPNLIRIAEPVAQNDFVAFAVRPDVKPASWRDLGPYTIAVITGWKIAEANTGHVREVTHAATAEQLFSLLRQGRADVAIYERWQGVALVAAGGGGARVVDPPLASVPMYLYVNRKYQALAPRLNETLRAMRVDGTLARIAAEALRP